ncbi:MAG: hypothetical protein QXP77_00100 [Candidatus Aenigmatarchaeota archaeon]
MKKGGIFILASVVIVLSIPITIIMFIYWLYTFRIHIFWIITEMYHYNRLQEIPLALISSDFKNESFVEGVNKAYYNFYSVYEVEENVNKILKKQVGEAYGLYIRINGMGFHLEEYGDCNVFSKHSVGDFYCFCTQECPRGGYEVPISDEIVDKCYDEENFAECLDSECLKGILPLRECIGEKSLSKNITYFYDTFPFPLVFNGSTFIEKMWFEAYG